MNLFILHRLLRWVMLMLCPWLQSDAAATNFPLPPPPASYSSTVAGALWLNGHPLHITRILSKAALPTLLAHYQHEFSGRLAQAEVGDHIILSSEQGQDFFTITLKPLAGNHREILVARRAWHEPLRPTLTASPLLPAGSSLLATLESEDGGRHSTQYVFRNAHQLTLNFDHLRRQLANQGLQPITAGQLPARRTEPARLEFFAGPGGEAQLLLMRRAAQTEAILTLIRSAP